EDAIRAVGAVDASAEQRAHARPCSPSATARSPFAAVSRVRAAAESMPQRSIRMATLAFPSASCRAAPTRSSEHPVSSRTIRAARARSFSFVVTTPTIRPRYVWPSWMNTPVLIMFSVTFCAVPALSRVEPATTSGPASISMATSAAAPRGDPGAQPTPLPGPEVVKAAAGAKPFGDLVDRFSDPVEDRAHSLDRSTVLREHQLEQLASGEAVHRVSARVSVLAHQLTDLAIRTSAAATPHTRAAP